MHNFQQEKNDALYHVYLNNSRMEYLKNIRILGFFFDNEFT